MKRGEIYYARLHDRLDHVEDGVRPVLIVQNDIGNYYSQLTIAVPLTTKLKKLDLPTHIIINEAPRQSMTLCEQIMTIDKDDLGDCIGICDEHTMRHVGNALKASLGIL